MDSEKSNVRQAEGNKIPSNDGEAESEMFENGIIAGDMDSLLEMFEEAETVLSSSVDCIFLTHSDISADREGIPEASIPFSHSSSLPDVKECCATALNMSSITQNMTAEEHRNRTCQESSLDETTEFAVSGDILLCSENPAEPKTTDCGELEAKSSVNRTESEEFYFDENSLGLAKNSNSAAKSSTASVSVEFGLWSPMSLDRDDTQTEFNTENSTAAVADTSAGETYFRNDDSETSRSDIQTEFNTENSIAAVPGSSAGETSFRKDDSETSSDWDDDFPLEDRYSDSSSSPNYDTPYCRGRGSTTRRDGPRRRQGRGRVKPTEEETLYDRLPSYYTVFSRPNRTPTGLIRSSRSCFKLILNSELPSRDRDPSPDSNNQIFDKVPSYQSCFTNSTRYDEDSEICLKFEGGGPYDDDGSPRSGRGHGSRPSYAHSRPRFRSRSRLRSVASPRHRYSARTVNQDHTSSLTTLDKINAADAGISIHDRQSLDADSQNLQLELNQNMQKEQQRRILYIGGIPPTLTAERLKEIFAQFGQIEKCTVHFRECGDNYGFVTYVQSSDAYKAVEGGRRIQGCEHFDICFGGRRNFCRADYFDLDGNVEMEEELAPVIPRSKAKQDFDKLLMDALLKRKLQ